MGPTAVCLPTIMVLVSPCTSSLSLAVLTLALGSGATPGASPGLVYAHVQAHSAVRVRHEWAGHSQGGEPEAASTSHAESTLQIVFFHLGLLRAAPCWAWACKHIVPTMSPALPPAQACKQGDLGGGNLAM